VIVGLAGTIAGQALRYWAVLTLGERWNTRIIVIPEAPPIADGPYRYLRHPNYLAVVLELACIPLIRGLWFTAIGFSLANALMLSIRIPAEERALGTDYARTFASRRRFVPRLP
jgi:methyltransferase